jgi:hypothetical protein
MKPVEEFRVSSMNHATLLLHTLANGFNLLLNKIRRVSRKRNLPHFIVILITHRREYYWELANSKKPNPPSIVLLVPAGRA